MKMGRRFQVKKEREWWIVDPRKGFGWCAGRESIGRSCRNRGLRSVGVTWGTGDVAGESLFLFWTILGLQS